MPLQITRRQFLRRLVLAAGGSALSAAGCAPRLGSATQQVTILHVNDLHGALYAQAEEGGERGGAANLVGLIERVRAQAAGPVLLLDAGDAFQGTYVSNSNRGRAVIELMNLAGVDALALGNHEFDWGLEVLAARASEAAFPFLAANLETETGETLPWVQPYALLEAGEATVGVLGLTYHDLKTIVKAEAVAGVRSLPPAEAVRRYLPELQSKADWSLILSHLGLEEDRALAEAFPEIPLIVGGHSHRALSRGQWVGETLIAQAGSQGAYLGQIDAACNQRQGRLERAKTTARLIKVTDAGTASAEAEAIVARWGAEAEERGSEVVGEAAVPLPRGNGGETALGNLITDAMRATELGDGAQFDIAVHNDGGIRAGLDAGPITYAELYAVLPFDNDLVGLDLTGAQVREVLENGMDDRGSRIQVSGLRYTYSMNKSRGRRVVDVTVHGERLDPERIYRVVTIDYLQTNPKYRLSLGLGTNVAYGGLCLEAVIAYVRAHSPVSPAVEGRIERI